MNVWLENILASHFFLMFFQFFSLISLIKKTKEDEWKNYCDMKGMFKSEQQMASGSSFFFELI